METAREKEAAVVKEAQRDEKRKERKDRGAKRQNGAKDLRVKEADRRVQSPERIIELLLQL